MDLMSYLQKNKERYLDDAARFAAENREDEAVLSKIRANVFDIFMQTGDKTDNVLEYLQAKWEKEKALAEEHGDAAATAIEQIKLETLHKIQQEVIRHG
ncbi:MAG: hypothetical protein FWC69_04530 [Defluviitaleaceae bacterium]|nr:hypothetical protein [Defluviitaleaceae bacterium]